MKTVRALLDFFAIALPGSAEQLDQTLTGLFVDSRHVSSHSVFVALQGHRHHGLDFCQTAIQQGATLILSDQPPAFNHPEKVVFIEGLQTKLAELAKWFYDDPSQKLKLVGITGTNGKTSTAHYVGQILSPKAKVAIMGTLGNGVLGELKPSANTTLETLALNHQLNEFVQQQVDYVVMEVSSHAVALGRIDGLSFEVLALTQVTRDHLDFHQTEKAYRDAKKALFLNYPAKVWVLNQQDSLGRQLFLQAPEQVRIGYRTQQNGEASTLCFEHLDYDAQGFQGTLKYGKIAQATQIGLMGAFNVENLLCAIGISQALNIDWSQVFSVISQLKPVSGRMEPVAHRPTAIIDYAHTPDALEAVLNAVKQHLSEDSGQLWVVFGCGGDRDQGKRPIMGQIAERYADQVIVTDDNPRFESPEWIVAQIVEGMTHPPLVIHNRAQAIQHAMTQAADSDIVVVAGKGHEDYQDIQGVKYPMNDAEMILAANQT